MCAKSPFRAEVLQPSGGTLAISRDSLFIVSADCEALGHVSARRLILEPVSVLEQFFKKRFLSGKSSRRQTVLHNDGVVVVASLSISRRACRFAHHHPAAAATPVTHFSTIFVRCACVRHFAS